MTLIIPKLALSNSETEERRLDELQTLGLLEPSSDGRFDRYVELAAKALLVPMAAVILVDKDVLRFKAARGLPRKNPPQDMSFAGQALSAPGTLVVPDASLDPRFSQHPIVKGEPHVRFYAGAAIRGRSGVPLGVICVADAAPRQFSEEEADILTELARLLEYEIQTHAAVEELKERVSQQALHDASTGLPNEALFLRQLSELLSVRRRKSIGLALVRFNRLEQVHRALGKVGVEYVVNQAVMRLRAGIGAGGLLGHPREDMIAVALPVRRSDMVSAEMEKLVACFREPFMLGEHKFPTHVGIGVALCPDDATDAGALLKRARTALDSDDKTITSKYRLYNPKLSSQAVRKFQIESALGEAAARNELSMVYQPKIRCSDRQIVGAEALLRWTNETLGAVSPAEFVPIAEESGLILELGAWVLERACMQMVEWASAGCSCPELSVNVAGDQLTSPGFSDQIRKVLKRTRLAGDRLNLEVTEGSLIGNMEEALQVMGELRELGVRFSIDDFGKGFSSLSYLQQMPVKTLKIDRKFVENVPERENDSMLVNSIVAMGHALGLDVVAEGVEREKQWRFLRDAGCDQVQGFLFGAPLMAHQFARVSSGRTRASRVP